MEFFMLYVACECLKRKNEVKVLVAHSCRMNCSLPGSSVHGILQAVVLEWVANSSSRGSSQPRDWTQVSCTVGRFFTVWATRVSMGVGGPYPTRLHLEVQRNGVSLDGKTSFQQRQTGCFRSSQKPRWMVNKKRKEPCFSLKLDSQRFSCKGAIKCELWVFDEN